MPFLREKSGRWSPEKIAAFALAIAPVFWLLGRVLMDDLGPRPVTEAIHFSGRWAVRLLLVSLLISPARRLLPFGKLILARRTLGVAACCWAVFHFLLYVADQKFKLATVATEIVLRFYLTIGFIGLVGLIALGITSTDAAIRRLGSRWNTLHLATYPIAILGILHFMLQKKLDIYEPTLMIGFLLWLLGYRLLQRRLKSPGVIPVALLGIGAAALTAAIEALWYMAMTGVHPLMVLQANFAFEDDLRPAWWVLIVTLAVALASAVVQWWQPKPAPRQRLRAAE